MMKVECVTINERKRIMKKNNYIQPAVEIMAVNATCAICVVSQNAPLNNGGGSQTIDPGQGI